MKRPLIVFGLFIATVFVSFIVTILIIVDTAGSASATPTTPGLPTIPPPLPTQVTNGDGTRLNCTPNYQYCWQPPESWRH